MVSDEPVRSGSRNLLANWQIVAISLLEALVAGYLLSPLVRVMVKSVVRDVSAGSSPAQWMAAAGAAAALVPLLLLALAVHALVLGGNAAVYLAGEEKALTAHPHVSEVSSYRAFTFGQWWRAGLASMWRVAAAHAVVFGIVLLTFGLVVAPFGLMRNWRSLGCLVSGLTVPLAFAAVLGAMICLPKAVVLVVGRTMKTWEALKLAWAQSAGRLRDHAGAAILVVLVTGVAGGMLAAVTASFPPGTSWAEMASAAEGLVGTVSGCWLLSIMTALTDLSGGQA